VRATLSAPPPVPSARVRGIPPALDRAIVRALLKRPEERFADARAFAAALRAARDEGSAPRPVTAAAPGPAAVTRVLPAPVPVVSAAADPVPADEEAEGGGRFPVLIVAIVVLVAAALVGPAVFAMSSASQPAASDPVGTSATPSPTPSAAATSRPSSTPGIALVAVPPLGALADAASALQAAGLRLGAVAEADSTQAKGVVLSANPSPGARVAPGTVVALTVASGRNAVPAVAGMSRDEAQAALRDAGFTAWELPVTVPGAAAGTVVATRPDRGSSEWLGTAITLLVAADPGATPTPTGGPEGTPPASPSPGP
jgi:eukaryotic-like serine/threonine-protein kinase